MDLTNQFPLLTTATLNDELGGKLLIQLKDTHIQDHRWNHKTTVCVPCLLSLRVDLQSTGHTNCVYTNIGLLLNDFCPYRQRRLFCFSFVWLSFCGELVGFEAFRQFCRVEL